MAVYYKGEKQKTISSAIIPSRGKYNTTDVSLIPDMAVMTVRVF